MRGIGNPALCALSSLQSSPTAPRTQILYHVQYPCWRYMVFQDKISRHTPAIFPGEKNYNAALK